MKPESWWFRIVLIIGIQVCSGYCKCLSQKVARERHFYVDEHELPIRIEVSNRIAHQLVTRIFRILLIEVIGYPDVVLVESDDDSARIGENATRTLQKITNCITPTECYPTDIHGPEIMINLEVWLGPNFNMEGWTTEQVENGGPLGPIGRIGWLVADYIAKELWIANHTILEHWRTFTDPSQTILFDLTREDMMLTSFTINPKTNTTYCGRKECGTLGIYRPPQCREPNVFCATLLADYADYSFDMLKHQITSLKLLVNVAWVGPNLEKMVSKRIISKKYTIFYHKKPTFLSSLSNFSLVTFPHCEDQIFSECEFDVYQLEKIVWSKIKTHAPLAFHLIQAMSFTQDSYVQLLYRYSNSKLRGQDLEQTACSWVGDNQYLWHKWTPDGLQDRQQLYIGGIFPLSGIYWRQRGVIPAARMAVEAINRNSTLLKDYRLTLLELNGQCMADEVMKSFINYVTNSTIYWNMIGILGPACSDTVEPIAGVAKHFNTIIISYSAEGSLFNDRERYPYFFRTIPENNQFRYVYLRLFQHFNWRRVAALTEDGQKYPEYLSHLQDLLQSSGMNFIVNRKFPRERMSLDMKPYLQDLKSRNARIIIGDFYDYAARAVMCEAYKMEMTAAHGYQWFLPLWFTSNWFDTDLHNSLATQPYERVPCTTEEMIEAINGHLSLAYKFYADSGTVMQEGHTVGEWYKAYSLHVQALNMEISRYGGYAYDAVWIYAKALDSLFKENKSYVATLHTEKTSRRFVELLNETKIDGVSGSMQYIASSRLSEVVLWQWLKNTTRVVGVYNPYSQEDGKLELNESRIVWLTANGQKPGDGSTSQSSCIFETFMRRLNVSCEMAVAVVNIIVFSMLFLIMAFGVVFFKRRYDRRMKQTEARMKELGISSTSGLALDTWEMPKDHIVINRKLGEGAFGTVYGGEAFIQNKGWVAIAVKTLKVGAKTEEKLDFLSEAEVMKKFDHINIVQLVGVCTMGEPVYTVMEFMLYGDLKTYLLGRRNLVTESDRVKSDEVSDRRLTNIALDVARGLSYLADLKYVHRDLACRNCLVNAARSVKIGDFGMCRPMYDSDYYRFNKKGMLPVRWMAPESLSDGLFTPMSDVWSYGVLLYEVITFGSFPYQGFSNNQVLEYVKNFNTLSVPKGCKPELEELLTRCWSRVPEKRPKAVEIVEALANNPELISPYLGMPTASVEADDTDSLEITIHERSRGHSLSSIWRSHRHFSTPDHLSTAYGETVQNFAIATNQTELTPISPNFSRRNSHYVVPMLRPEHKDRRPVNSKKRKFPQVTHL